MARPRAKLDRLDQAGQVIRRLQSQPPGRERERLLAVRFGLQGDLSLQEIARRVGRSRATIQSWFEAYRSGGIEQLCRRSSAKRGPRSRLHERAALDLRKKLAKGSFRRAEEARIWLESRFGIQARPVTVRAWLRKLGARG